MNKIQNQASNDNFKTRKAYVSETREKKKGAEQPIIQSQC